MLGRRSKPRRSERVRDPAYLAFVHTLPCAARDVPGHRCEGPIEADHMGARPMGRKCSDREAAPLCSLGHRERTDFSGAFRSFDKERMRAFLAGAIESTQAAHRAYVEAGKPTPGWR